MTTDNFCFLFSKQTNPKPVKQVVNGTVILYPLVFGGDICGWPRHTDHGILKGEVSLFHWPPVWLVWNQLYGVTDNVCFYWQNRLILTSQTGGQWYSDASPFSIICADRRTDRVDLKMNFSSSDAEFADPLIWDDATWWQRQKTFFSLIYDFS